MQKHQEGLCVIFKCTLEQKKYGMVKHNLGYCVVLYLTQNLMGKITMFLTF